MSQQPAAEPRAIQDFYNEDIAICAGCGRNNPQSLGVYPACACGTSPTFCFVRAELPRAPLVAESGWFFRFFTRGATRVSLTAGAVRFGNRSGNSVTEMPVSSIEALSIRRFLFRTRLTVRTAEGKQCSIGGLDKRRAASVHDAILAEAARSVVSLREKLKQIDWQQQQLFAGDEYIRHSVAMAFHNALLQSMQRYHRLNRLSRMQLEPGTWGALKRLTLLESAKWIRSCQGTRERAFRPELHCRSSCGSRHGTR